MEKLLKDKKMMALIIVGTIGIIAMLLLIAFGISKAINHITPEKTAQEEELLEMGVPQKEIDKMSDEEKETLINNEYYDRVVAKDYVYNSRNNEYEDTDKELKLLYEYLGSFKFDEIISNVEPLLKRHNFTTSKNKEIVQIYEDATTLTRIYNIADSNYENVLSNLISPVTMAVTYFNAPISVVKEVTKSDIAKFPIYDGKLTIVSDETLSSEALANEDVYNYIKTYVVDGLDSVHRVTLRGKLAAIGGTATVRCYVNQKYNKDVEMIGCFDIDNYSLDVNQLSER